MNKRNKIGFINLAKKSLAALTASMGVLLGNNVTALSPETNINSSKDDIDINKIKSRVLRPKLILKLNISSPENSVLSMHTSHSSHSSHSSHYSSSSGSSSSGHSSHSSHSSHYSSSPSYTPSSGYSPSPQYTPASTPVTPSHSSSNPSYVPFKKSVTLETTTTTEEQSDALQYYTLGSRVMYKGCQGTDVKELQELLKKLNYDVPITGYFGDKTDVAVRKFQTSNELKPDGRVGVITLSLIKSK